MKSIATFPAENEMHPMDKSLKPVSDLEPRNRARLARPKIKRVVEVRHVGTDGSQPVSAEGTVGFDLIGTYTISTGVGSAPKTTKLPICSIGGNWMTKHVTSRLPLQRVELDDHLTDLKTMLKGIGIY